MSEPSIRMVTEERLLREAWGWQTEAPRWFRESQEAEAETLEHFLETAPDRLFYGIFEDEELKALIRLEPFRGRIFGIDLFARRDLSLEVLTSSGLSIKCFLYDRGVANGFFGWIPRFNRGIVKLYRNLGFAPCGIRCFKGRTHGKAVEWWLMTNKKEV